MTHLHVRLYTVTRRGCAVSVMNEPQWGREQNCYERPAATCQSLRNARAAARFRSALLSDMLSSAAPLACCSSRSLPPGSTFLAVNGHSAGSEQEQQSQRNSKCAQMPHWARASWTERKGLVGGWRCQGRPAPGCDAHSGRGSRPSGITTGLLCSCHASRASPLTAACLLGASHLTAVVLKEAEERVEM